MSTATLKPEDLINGAEAAKTLGVTVDQLSRMGRLGKLTVRRIPGTRPMYLRSEVEALAESSMRPACA